MKKLAVAALLATTGFAGACSFLGRQAFKQHIGPKAVKACRSSPRTKAVLIRRLDQSTAFDQAAKILFVQMRAENSFHSFL